MICSTTPCRDFSVALSALLVLSGIPRASAQVPIGPEFTINQATLGDQTRPEVAALSNGGFVVVWKDEPRDYGDGSSIMMRLFDNDGIALGGEVQANSYNTGFQTEAAVAADGVGNFIVSWGSFPIGDEGRKGIFARRFNSFAEPIGAEFQVNTDTSAGREFQVSPNVDMAGDGRFVISWMDIPAGPFVRIFDSFGVAVGPELSVIGESGDADAPISLSASGSFVIALTEFQSPSPNMVLAQRHGQDGGAMGEQIVVTDNGELRSISGTEDGRFVVAWNRDPSFQQDDVFVRRYDEAGVPLGDEILVNSFTTGMQGGGSVTLLEGGDFVVGWESGDYDSPQDGDYAGIVTRLFDADGEARGPEVLVNTYTTGWQVGARIAVAPNGRFMVVWNDDNPFIHPGDTEAGKDGSGDGVFGRVFEMTPASVPPTPTRPPDGTCVGDCDGDGTVMINELIRGVNITLGNHDVSTCPAMDGNDNGSVAVNELIQAVNNSLNGCNAVAPTPSESPRTPTPTPTPVRFVDNGDGTITDLGTGLMWEKKTGTLGSTVFCSDSIACPDPHNVTNLYQWSSSQRGSSGTLFDGGAKRLFLDSLNDVAGGGMNCFAGHCDWRLPSSAGSPAGTSGEAAELESIVDCSGGAPCVDPIFGPTASNDYWSSSPVANSLHTVWVVSFDNGHVGANGKISINHARAVRGGS